MIFCKKAKILIVNNQESIWSLLHKVLTGQERTIVAAEGGRKAIKLFLQKQPVITILDLWVPAMSGLD